MLLGQIYQFPHDFPPCSSAWMFTKYIVVVWLWEEEVIFLSLTELGHTEVKIRNAHEVCTQVELHRMLFESTC